MSKPLYARVSDEMHERVHHETPEGMTPARFAGVLLALGWQAYCLDKINPDNDKSRRSSPAGSV